MNMVIYELFDGAEQSCGIIAVTENQAGRDMIERINYLMDTQADLVGECECNLE